MRKPRLSTGEKAIIIVVLIAAIGIGLWTTEDYWRPAEVLPYLDSYDTVTLGFYDERSGAAINPAVTLTGVTVSYGPSKITATGGTVEYAGVPKGSYTVKTELTGYYDETDTLAIESTTLTFSSNFSRDNIGTFSWAETAAAGAPGLDENDQVMILRIYLHNSAKDTVLKNVRVKLVAVVDGHENIVIDDLECTSHNFEEDDLTAEKWIISGITIGDIEGEATTTVTYRITLDVGATADPLVFTASIQDLDGDSPETSASKTITWTAA